MEIDKEFNESRKKSVAFLANEDKKPSSNDEKIEQLTLIVKKLEGQAKNNKWGQKSKSSSKVVCFKCKEEGHVKRECPLLQRSQAKPRYQDKENKYKEKWRKYRRKNRAHLAEEMWSDSSSSFDNDSDDEEIATVCLMANEDPKVTSSTNLDVTLDEVIDAYDDLGIKHKELESQYNDLMQSCEDFNLVINEKEKKNEKLKDKIKKFEKK